jgi:hypothetical protein
MLDVMQNVYFVSILNLSVFIATRGHTFCPSSSAAHYCIVHCDLYNFGIVILPKSGVHVTKLEKAALELSYLIRISCYCVLYT